MKIGHERHCLCCRAFCFSRLAASQSAAVLCVARPVYEYRLRFRTDAQDADNTCDALSINVFTLDYAFGNHVFLPFAASIFTVYKYVFSTTLGFKAMTEFQGRYLLFCRESFLSWASFQRSARKGYQKNKARRGACEIFINRKNPGNVCDLKPSDFSFQGIASLLFAPIKEGRKRKKIREFICRKLKNFRWKSINFILVSRETRINSEKSKKNEGFIEFWKIRRRTKRRRFLTKNRK